MNSQQRNLIRALLAVVATCGANAYLLLVAGYRYSLTITQLALLLQTLCLCCGVAALLVLMLGSPRHQ